MRETFLTTCLRYASPSSAQASDFHTWSPEETAASTSCFPEAGTSKSCTRLSAGQVMVACSPDAGALHSPAMELGTESLLPGGSSRLEKKYGRSASMSASLIIGA